MPMIVGNFMLFASLCQGPKYRFNPSIEVQDRGDIQIDIDFHDNEKHVEISKA